MANQKFTSIKNDYALILDRNSDIINIEDDMGIQQVGFDFTGLEEISQFEQMRTIDVIGIATDVGNIGTVNLKSGGTKDRKNITLADESKQMI